MHLGFSHSIFFLYLLRISFLKEFLKTDFVFDFCTSFESEFQISGATDEKHLKVFEQRLPNLKFSGLEEVDLVFCRQCLDCS